MKKITFILTIVQNTLIGRSKQSIGNATFTTWKGKNVLKSKPITVENPRTDGQVTQRLRMKGIVGLYRQISAAIQLGFKERAIGKSEYNAFVSANIIDATTVTLPNTVDIVWANVKASLGTIFQTEMTSVTGDGATDLIQLTFPTTAGFPGQSLTDKITVVAFNEDTAKFVVKTELALRTASPVSVSGLGMTAGDTIHVYTFFTNADGSKSSDSTYDSIVAS